MNKIIAIGAGLILLVLLLLFTTTYTVSFHEVAVKTRFGQAGADPVVRDPGLHFKLPFFIDQINTFDTRLQLVESPLETVAIADGQQILVRSYLLWQVDPNGDGPLQFFKSYGAIGKAGDDLRDSLSSAIGAMGEYELRDLLGAENRLNEAEQRVLDAVVSAARPGGVSTGVLPRQVGISKIVLPPATTRSVIERMKVTRQTLANNERGKGNAESARIMADANTKAEKIRAFANNFAAEIRGEGDRVAATYLAQMAEDPEFAIFLTWKQAFEDMLSSYTTFILPPDFAPLHLIDLDPSVRATGGIPMPSEEEMSRVAEAVKAASERGGAVTATPTGTPSGGSDGEPPASTDGGEGS